MPAFIWKKHSLEYWQYLGFLMLILRL